MRYLVINKDTDIIVNAVELIDSTDPKYDWDAPTNCYVVQTDTFDIGQKYEGPK